MKSKVKWHYKKEDGDWRGNEPPDEFEIFEGEVPVWDEDEDDDPYEDMEPIAIAFSEKVAKQIVNDHNKNVSEVIK